jgi:hypothetical protein
MKVKLNISIWLTWSKIMAFIILILAFVLDFANNKAGTVFMFSIPFVVFLITGKQFFDRNKEYNEQIDTK